jgi:Protein of unknown function (DUF3775)
MEDAMADPTHDKPRAEIDDDRVRLRARAGVDSEETPLLAISPEKVCFIVFKARQFDAKDAPSLSDDGSDPADDDMRAVLEDHPDDPVRQELASFISALSYDEQIDLVTLMWMGRGDGTLADWYELRDTACNEHTPHTARYLLGTPMLADFLAEGLAQFGISCEEFAAGI